MLNNDDTLPGIIAYHGTPHAVDKFSIANIGTGDGNRRYGYGLYFAGDEEEAKKYTGKTKTDILMDGNPISYDLISFEENRIVKLIENRLALGFDIEDAKKFAAEYAETAPTLAGGQNITMEEVERVLRRISQDIGNVYKVKIKLREDELLFWDKKPNKKTIKQIVQVLEKYSHEPFIYSDSIRYLKNGRHFSFDLHNGSTVYDGVLSIFDWNEKLASEVLHSAGIKGIKYNAVQEKTYNYVLFSDDDVEIVGRSGENFVHDLGEETIFGVEESVDCPIEQGCSRMRL